MPALILLIGACWLGYILPRTSEEEIPHLQREFRGVWVATVNNIDWPSRRTLTTDQQQGELIRILDLAKQLNLNAIILQVRPQSDALYASAIEPWSEYLTGEMGKAPEPFYDPLEFAVQEAHKRGLELHAWFNPYRALDPSSTSPPAPNHISRTHPGWVKSYGPYLWLDPGKKEVQDYLLSIILDVVRRYDIDGVHFDDYFYPYPLADKSQQTLPFPDDESWRQYADSGVTLSRDDWRRRNVNELIRRVYRSIKEVKPFIKFGISPFGIWRPGHPAGITGRDTFNELYADSREWLREGWVDYLTPQLYWPIEDQEHSYTLLLDWWISQNIMGRHIWPGDAVSPICDHCPPLPVAEIVDQVNATRRRPGSTGNVHFSMKSFLQNRDHINQTFRFGPYAQPALVPALPWIDSTLPRQPSVALKRDEKTDEIVVRWEGEGTKQAFWWVLYIKDGATWRSLILPSSLNSYQVPRSSAGTGKISLIAVSAVDRLGNESPRTVVRCCGT